MDVEAIPKDLSKVSKDVRLSLNQEGKLVIRRYMKLLEKGSIAIIRRSRSDLDQYSASVAQGVTRDSDEEQQSSPSHQSNPCLDSSGQPGLDVNVDCNNTMLEPMSLSEPVPMNTNKEIEPLMGLAPFLGKWIVDQSRSDSLDGVLSLTGVGWAMRRAACNANPTNKIRFEKVSQFSGCGDNPLNEWKLVIDVFMPLGIVKTQELFFNGSTQNIKDDLTGEWQSRSRIETTNGKVAMVNEKWNPRVSITEKRSIVGEMADGVVYQVMEVEAVPKDVKMVSKDVKALMKDGRIAIKRYFKQLEVGAVPKEFTNATLISGGMAAISNTPSPIQALSTVSPSISPPFVGSDRSKECTATSSDHACSSTTSTTVPTTDGASAPTKRVKASRRVSCPVGPIVFESPPMTKAGGEGVEEPFVKTCPVIRSENVCVLNAMVGVEDVRKSGMYRSMGERAVNACERTLSLVEDYRNKQGEWISLGKSKDVECYRLALKNIGDSKSNTDVYLGEIRLDNIKGDSRNKESVWTKDAVADYLYHPLTRNEYDSQLSVTKRVALYPDFTAVIYQAFKKVMGVPGRDFLFSIHKTTNKSGNCVVIGCSGLCPTRESVLYDSLAGKIRDPQCVPARMILAGYVISDIIESDSGRINGVKVTFVSSIDLCGSIPHFISKSVLCNQLTNLASVRDKLFQKREEFIKMEADIQAKGYAPIPVTCDEPFFEFK
eukprot:Filipodium_phascolosomae@DN1207_c0_g1_i1.p1